MEGAIGVGGAYAGERVGEAGALPAEAAARADERAFTLRTAKSRKERKKKKERKKEKRTLSKGYDEFPHYDDDKYITNSPWGSTFRKLRACHSFSDDIKNVVRGGVTKISFRYFFLRPII